MRFLIGLILAAAVLWSGYWFVGSNAKHEVLEQWFQTQAESGWTASYTEFDVVGYPNRFDSRFETLELADPRSGYGWSAPFFNILALSYQPNHIIAIWPNDQVLKTPNEDVRIESSEMQASVVFEPNTSLALDRFTLRTSDLALAGSSGWESRMKDAGLTIWQTVGKTDFYDINLTAAQVLPAAATRAVIDPENMLPDTIERFFVDGQLGFDGPWDRHAVETRQPLITRINLNDVTLIWGNLELRLTGGVDIDADGYPTGDIEVSAKNWRDMVALAVSAGAIDDKTAGNLTSGLAFMAMMSDDPAVLNVPLTYANRQVSLGPIPLGPAPRLR